MSSAHRRLNSVRYYFFVVAFLGLCLSCAGTLNEHEIDCRSKEHIAQVTLAYKPGMDALYNARLKTNPDIKGRLVAIFYVQASGKITQQPFIESSSLGDTVLEKQFLDYIKTWDYGKCGSRKKTMQIMYPFDFNTRPVK
jgi:hypothetical protein